MTSIQVPHHLLYNNINIMWNISIKYWSGLICYVICYIPVFEEHLENAENNNDMDTLEEEIQVPVKNHSRNTYETNDGLSNPTTTMNDETSGNDSPPLSSQIKSPENNQIKEEIQMLFCGSDEGLVKHLCRRNFPNSQYNGQHKRIKYHHLFSIHPTPAEVSRIKKDLNKLNKKINFKDLSVCEAGDAESPLVPTYRVKNLRRSSVLF